MANNGLKGFLERYNWEIEKKKLEKIFYEMS
jgi:hypothetical protein